MGMSTNIEAIRPPDEKWKKMKAIFDSCKNANIDPPDEIWDFFNGEPPSDLGVVIEIENTDAVEKVSEDMRDGFIVDLTELPKDVKYIKFYNSY